MDDLAVGRSLVLVVPCFNESGRLDVDEFVAAAGAEVMLVMVNDGSRDDTADMLDALAEQSPFIVAEHLERNVGKGEAVRAGLIRARSLGPHWVGYLDADLSTPFSEVVRLRAIAADRPSLEVVTGARIALLGRDIERSRFRHYTGRVFATCASGVLRRRVYDTQCGAKVFAPTASLDRALAEPFRSRWAFDVELLGRLAAHGTHADAFWEEPLERWHDVDGSRRSLRASIAATVELGSIRRDLQRGRRGRP